MILSLSLYSSIYCCNTSCGSTYCFSMKQDLVIQQEFHLTQKRSHFIHIIQLNIFRCLITSFNINNVQSCFHLTCQETLKNPFNVPPLQYTTPYYPRMIFPICICNPLINSQSTRRGFIPNLFYPDFINPNIYSSIFLLKCLIK